MRTAEASARRACSTSAIGLTVIDVVLLERDEQLRACADYLAEAAAGHGRLVYVAGARGLRILLGDTASANGTRRVDLPPLSPDAVSRLVSDHERHHPGMAPTDPGLHRRAPRLVDPREAGSP